jgi:hypothetical protein
MPVVWTNPAFPNQVSASATTQAYSVQLNFGSMLREVTNWNSNVDSEVAGRMINNRMRQIIDRRTWYATKTRGVANVPNIQTTGTATVTYGSPFVQGIGTNWTPTLVGLQFRQTFTQPYQTIVAVNPPGQPAQTIQLDTPYPGPTFTGAYYILQVYLTFGGNVKRLLWAANQLFGWPLDIGVKVEELNAKDQWRAAMGWATTMATRPPTPDGQFQVEVWPSPYAAQTFPFEAYTEPASMVLDTDTPQAWIRSDVIVTGAISDALLYRPKQNAFYDSATAVNIATIKAAQFQKDLLEMENADEGLEQQAVQWDYNSECIESSDYSLWGQMHR